MKKNLNRPLSRFLLLALAILVFALGWINRPTVTAQSPLQREGGEAARRQAYMEKVEADVRQSLENLQPAGTAPCVNGTADAWACQNVDLLAFMPTRTIGGTSSTNDIWGWTDPQTGTEYALVGMSNGTSFIDLSDPANPVYLGILPTHTRSSTWRDIKVYADHAFIVSEASGHGVQVFDLTQLRNVTNPPVEFIKTAHYGEIGSAHNIAINEDTGYAYVVGARGGAIGCSGGLHMVNIQNPASPTFAGCFRADGYTHDTQCVLYNGPDATYQGQEICFNSNEDTLTIVNVTNKRDPGLIARAGYSGSRYTHQGWLTEDHAFFLLGDELDESSYGHNTRTRIWDVSDLTNPTIIGINDGPNPSIDHNLYTHNGYVYESNYTSGLQIYDLSDVANGNMTLFGFFDVYAPNNNVGFSGSWSNYPYFASGIVVVTNSGAGMFVVQPVGLP